MIGIDVVDICRIEKLFCDEFLKKVFSEKEIVYINSKCNKVESAAGLYAVKEAIVKAVGTGFTTEVFFHDIEVQYDAFGAPSAVLSGKIHELMLRLGSEIHISISHSALVATAVAYIK